MGLKYLDTYALVEISKGNPDFSKYSNEECATTDLTLTEFYSVTLREYNEKTANYWLKQLESISKTVALNLLVKAVRYRHENKKENLSFFDCVGYIFAKENGMKFVTGDKEFEGKEGVEFVK